MLLATAKPLQLLEMMTQSWLWAGASYRLDALLFSSAKQERPPPDVRSFLGGYLPCRSARLGG